MCLQLDKNKIDKFGISQLDFFNLLDNQEIEKPNTIEEIEWSDNDIEQLRRSILESSIRILLDRRASIATVSETLEWLLSDEISPFSFEVCASDCGYSADDLRERTLGCMKKNKVKHTLIKPA